MRIWVIMIKVGYQEFMARVNGPFTMRVRSTRTMGFLQENVVQVFFDGHMSWAAPWHCMHADKELEVLGEKG
jgi:hypothetical protein